MFVSGVMPRMVAIMPGPVWTASRMSQSLPVAATELRSVFPQGRAMVHLACCAVFRGAGGAGFGFVGGAPGVAEAAFLGYGAGPVVGDGVSAGHAFDDADELRVDGEAGCGG